MTPARYEVSVGRRTLPHRQQTPGRARSCWGGSATGGEQLGDLYGVAGRALVQVVVSRVPPAGFEAATHGLVDRGALPRRVSARTSRPDVSEASPQCRSGSRLVTEMVTGTCARQWWPANACGLVHAADLLNVHLVRAGVRSQAGTSFLHRPVRSSRRNAEGAPRRAGPPSAVRSTGLERAPAGGAAHRGVEVAPRVGRAAGRHLVLGVARLAGHVVLGGLRCVLHGGRSIGRRGLD